MARDGPDDARLVVTGALPFITACPRPKSIEGPLGNVARHIENPVRAGALCESANRDSSFVVVGMVQPPRVESISTGEITALYAAGGIFPSECFFSARASISRDEVGYPSRSWCTFPPVWEIQIMPLDPTLIVITDRNILARASNMPMVDAVRAAAAGGATMIQYREKEMESSDLLREADELRVALEGTECAFTVNDRLDIALASGAAGVHLGQKDLPLPRAKALGGRLFYGVSAGRIEWAAKAVADGADYFGVGPIYLTGSKDNARPPIGPAGVGKILPYGGGIPAVAIGGMNADNLGPVIAAGAQGVAVIGAVMGSPDPEAAARELRRRIEEARG